MADINKEYYPYPGYDNYYQVTKSPYDKPRAVHEKTYNTKQVDQMINYVLSKINQSKGVVTESVNFADLPTPSIDVVGVIYNIKDQFTSDERFLDGAGKLYPDGTNVIVVASDGTYKFDVMMGEIEKVPDEGIEDIIDTIYSD